MEATIYKNDNFETVGFKVVNANVTLFSWGTTAEQFYYTKTVGADKYTAEVLELIKCERMRQYYEWDFYKEVCQVNIDPRNMAKRKDKNDTTTVIDNTERIKELVLRISNLISEIVQR